MKLYPEVTVDEFTLNKQDLVEISLTVETYVRKKYKGIWYLIPVYEKLVFSASPNEDVNLIIKKRTIDLINRTLKTAARVKEWYDIKSNIETDSVKKDSLQLSEKIRFADKTQLLKILNL